MEQKKKLKCELYEDWKLDFCLGNAIKYIARAGKKSDDVKTDLEKAAML